mmetsp:Transcript_40974/g.85306  ORF Transcript_40974/g.85306 Transcript_40974/m.85306 type:complete len:82 (-) Transcript_40974:448-693(-)
MWPTASTSPVWEAFRIYLVDLRFIRTRCLSIPTRGFCHCSRKGNPCEIVSNFEVGPERNYHASFKGQTTEIWLVQSCPLDF